MGILRKILNTAIAVGSASTGAFYYVTRNSQFVPFPANDPILSSAAYKKYNPNKNPVLQDLCIRRIPLSKIKPELLHDDGKLVEAFCAGVFGGLGYEIQRSILSHLHEGPSTAHQLWSQQALQTSSYEVGTQITNHFEVLEHTSDRIVVRAGDTPMRRDVRVEDGLFEISARVNGSEEVVEFGLKSVFFQGLGVAAKPPVPPPAAWLHRCYTKLLMETAVKNTVL